MLRADFHLLERAVSPADERIDCPLVLLYSNDDPEVLTAGAEAGKAHGADDVCVARITGGHFFLSENRRAELARVSRVLDRVAPRVRAP